MKIAMIDGLIHIKDLDSIQFQIIKSFGKMKWNRANKTLTGVVDTELLNKLAKMVRLPPHIETERIRLNVLSEAVDKERLNETPKEFIKAPIKAKPFAHQIRGYNMALLVLGFVDVEEIKKKDKKEDEKGV